MICVSTVNVYLPKDRVTNMHQQYGFVEYRGEEDADYVSCHFLAALCQGYTQLHVPSVCSNPSDCTLLQLPYMRNSGHECSLLLHAKFMLLSHVT